MAERRPVHLPDPRTGSGVRIVRHDRARPHGDGLAPSADAGPDARPSSRETPDDRRRPERRS